jgi:hypothetical protein
MAANLHPPGAPMTLANMREQGVRQTRALWSAVTRMTLAV